MSTNINNQQSVSRKSDETVDRAEVSDVMMVMPRPGSAVLQSAEGGVEDFAGGFVIHQSPC